MGKSTLFNKIVGSRIAITAEESGTTRDRIFYKVEHPDIDFFLVDTGGLDFGKGDTSIESEQLQQLVQEQEQARQMQQSRQRSMEGTPSAVHEPLQQRRREENREQNQYHKQYQYQKQSPRVTGGSSVVGGGGGRKMNMKGGR